MEISEIYNYFDKIGSLVFATIDNGYPETRIAHFFAHDEQGLYFRTMTTKPFYHQLKTTNKVSVCGMDANTEVNHDDEGLPVFDDGYSIRVSGDVKEVSIEYIKAKAKNDNNFLMGLKDIEKYPALRTFVLFQGRGEIFDFDFEEKKRNHKLRRTPFIFNDFTYPFRGLTINSNCVNCGLCMKSCSFKAIYKKEKKYMIDNSKCDACGDCTLVCNFSAIDVTIE